MPATSEARVIANRQNALKSTGPKTAEGKARSRQNGLKHGLTGSGVVVAPEDSSEVHRRTHSLIRELDPQSTLGRVLVGQLGPLSRSGWSKARSRKRPRSPAGSGTAAEVFDQSRFDQAEELFATLADAPKDRLRLKRSPEGVGSLDPGLARVA